MLGELLGRPLAAANCIVVAHSTAPKYLDILKNENQLDATYYFIVLLISSACFRLQAKARLKSCFSLKPGHYSSLTAPNFQPTANRERNDQCSNQHHSRELMMMGIVVPETC